LPLAAGTKLGPYEILAFIRAGGMGEVYRARDPRLNREVAIKVLPADRLADEGRRRRFVQEAQAASALNHPHIVTIHEIELHENRDFIVMEFVRGKSLEELIPRHGMRLGDVLRIAIPVADALAVAHAHGIVHRDLKPANVMAGSDTAVKVLDFGLAKLLSSAGDSSDSADETQTQAADVGLSSPGMVVGTAAYMSPEQATGQPVDARSDIFSFGAMLYEMVTGQRAFAGTSTADTLSAVIRAQPKPPTSVVAGVPPDLEKIILRCLRKDPARRFQHIDDVKVALLEVREESESGSVAAGTTPARSRLRAVALAVALAAVIGLVGFRMFVRFGQQRHSPITVTPLTTSGGGYFGPRLSPDGRTVAYAWTGSADDNWDVYVKAVGPGTKPLRLTDNPAQDVAPAWSPDGREIAFARLVSEGSYSIYLIPAFGGEERKLIDVQSVWYAGGYLLPRFTWSPDGRWLAYVVKPSSEKPAQILKLSLDTLESVPITTPREGTIGDTEPELSPDGRTLAFVRAETRDWGQADVWLQPVAGGEPKRLTSARYSIVNSLAWTADGSEVAFSTGYPGWAGQLRRVRVSGGEPEPVAGAGNDATDPSLRGDKAVFVQTHIETMSMYRVPNPRVPSGGAAGGEVALGDGVNAAYSADGNRIAFQSSRLGVGNIWAATADGTHVVQLTDLKQEAGTARWSPDGRWILFDSTEHGSYDLWVVASEGGIPRQLTHNAADDKRGSWSADGRWIYFCSNRTGREELWKLPAEGGTEVQVTREGGNYGIETPDGKTLFYSRFVDGVGRIRRLSLQTREDAEVVHDQVIWWNWALSKSGIYYMVYLRKTPEEASRSQPIEIRFQAFNGGNPVTVHRDTEAAAVRSMTVSPDEKWFVFSKQPLWQSQLMLIENFR
jgi:Tol biopolymer transport system component/tRNA A-37 threonylcarbamoyl transferase component Bud32